jgi:hypothetical protein
LLDPGSQPEQLRADCQPSFARGADIDFKADLAAGLNQTDCAAGTDKSGAFTDHQHATLTHSGKIVDPGAKVDDIAATCRSGINGANCNCPVANALAIQRA